MTTQSFSNQALTVQIEKSWPTVLVEVVAATAACVIMMGVLAITAWGVAGLLG
jgi:hypothetical protein